MIKKRKIIKLESQGLVSIKLVKDQKIEILMGSKNNKVVFADLSPWFNFKDKNPQLTSHYYVYDPNYYNPEHPNTRARKLIGENEAIILGKARNQIYFGNKGKWDDKLQMEHVKLLLKDRDKIYLNNLSSKIVQIYIRSKKSHE